MRYLYSLLLCIGILSSNAQEKNNSTLNFEFGTTKLTESSKAEILQLINTLKQNSVSNIAITGYTDKIGSEEFNMKLSLQRAEEIMSLLKKEFPNINIIIKGMGATNLLSGKDEEQFRNRRVEIGFEYSSKENEESIVEVQGFREDVEKQQFNIDLNDTVIIKAKGGTFLKIPPGSIQNKKGEIVKGKAEIFIKEYYNPSDILLSGINSVSDQGLLQSAGMFQILITQGGDTLNSETKKPIEIRLPLKDKSLDNMLVFTNHSAADTFLWNSTGKFFKQLNSYWAWPRSVAFLEVDYGNDNYYDNISIGHKYEESYRTNTPIISFSTKEHKDFTKPFAKTVSYKIEKIDSNVILVNTKIKFKNRGYRILGKRNLDTTFKVYHKTAEYQGYASSLNWINCDRFLKNNNNINFYASTPGYKGLKVLVYFKKLKAFMEASPENIENGKYQIFKVPPHEEVELIAIGKKDENIYFGKSELVTKNGKTEKIKVEKINKVDFLYFMQNL